MSDKIIVDLLRPDTSLSSWELLSSDEELFRRQVELLHEYDKIIIEMREAEEKEQDATSSRRRGDLIRAMTTEIDERIELSEVKDGGGECNGVLHDDEVEVVLEENHSDGSYEFINGVDVVSADDLVVKDGDRSVDVEKEKRVDVDVDVDVVRSVTEEEGISRSELDQIVAIDEEKMRNASGEDLDENQESQILLVESQLPLINNGEKAKLNSHAEDEDHVEFELHEAKVVEEHQNLVTETSESEVDQINNVTEKDVGEVEALVESESSQLDNGEEKEVGEEGRLDSVPDEEKMVKDESLKPDNDEERIDEQNKSDLSVEVEVEDRDSQIADVHTVQSDIDSGKEKEPMNLVDEVLSEETSSGDVEIVEDAEHKEETDNTSDEIELQSKTSDGSAEVVISALANPLDELKSESNVCDAENGNMLASDPPADCEQLVDSKVGNDESSETVSTCPVDDDLGSETKVNGDLSEKDHCIPSGPADDVAVESDATNSCIETSTILLSRSVSDEQLETVVSNGSISKSESEPNCENEMDQSISVDSDDKAISEAVELIERVDKNGSRPPSVEKDTTADTLEEQKVEDEVVRKPFRYLIRLPTYVDDNKIRDQIKLALLQVDDHTRRRDAIRVAIQPKKALCGEYRDKFEAAKLEERVARDALNAKRQEMDSVQSVINKLKNARSVDDMADRIKDMEYKQAHETRPLKEERQLISEIRLLKQQREQLRSSLDKQAEVQPTLDERDGIEERFKLLKREIDSARSGVMRSEGLTKAARKVYIDESEKLKEINAQFRAADNLRQKAYIHVQNLKKQLYEKNKYFRLYNEDRMKAEEYGRNGDREALESLCGTQVESVMELWNMNEEFRKEYVRCNTFSTVRRFKTLDGRSLGPDEEPLILRDFAEKRSESTALSSAKMNSSTPLASNSEQEFPVLPRGSEKADVRSTVNFEERNTNADVKSVVTLERKELIAKSKKAMKSAALENGSVTVSESEEVEKKVEEETKQAKEEEELARKAEELARKAEELRKDAEAKLKELRRLDEKTKAKEAEERKKRNAEKALAKAEVRAQKEAELKEKEREKRARKKGRKNNTTAEAITGGIEGESASISESVQPEITGEPELKEKLTTNTTATKRLPKPSSFSKQIKTKAAALPPPLRNRSKRRMQPWMWVLLVVVIVLALFLVVGNNAFF
ncbi:hypothetical protein GIB67_033764 [Kingdonia uniflora]|uniref:Proton pump-interactor 1 n=1 Tax=Kingdonia uniflora TaxID=39325 RepID=A0A7J7P4N5_9MAGN|nr:hypothetical protein GIB67_033764 [Kingdonia uniflora]